MRERTFALRPRDVAILLLVNIAVQDIVLDESLNPDVLDELKDLWPKLEALVLSLKEKPHTAEPDQRNAV